VEARRSEWSSARFRAGGVGGVCTEVVVLEAVAVALEEEDLGVVDEPADHRCGRVVANISHLMC